MLGTVAGVEDGGRHDVTIAIRQVAQIRAACEETQARFIVGLNRLLEPFVGNPAATLRDQNADLIRWLGTPESELPKSRSCNFQLPHTSGSCFSICRKFELVLFHVALLRPPR